jgi:N-sulfoglucosamine sulfohydrolase
MKTFTLLTIVFLALGFSQLQVKAVDRPNIVFIIADDLTHRDVSCYGGENVATPNIDSIAEEGMRFTRCFQAAPMCSPTRHNIYTGLYPVKSGAYPNSTLAKDGIKSVVHYLGALGYRVGLTGKRHIQPQSVFPFDYLSKEGDPDLAALETYLAKDNNQPSCTFICFNEPHTPWTKGDAAAFDPAKLVLPPYFVDTKETRKQLVNYYAEVKDLDNSVGQVIGLLDKLKMRENTLLIFVSEQGIAMPFAKWTCYDNGLQSAFVARWPGMIKPGSVSEAMIEYVDVLPTFIEVAGGEPVEVLEGNSLLPVLLGQRNHHKDYVYALQTTRGITNGSDHYGVRSIRSSRYKLIINLTPEVPFKNNLTENKGGWTSFWPTWVEAAKTDTFAKETTSRYQWRPAEELYDIVNDPYEFNNLAGEKRWKAEKTDLRLRLLRWMDEQGDLGQETEMAALSRTFKPGGTAGKKSE